MQPNPSQSSTDSIAALTVPTVAPAELAELVTRLRMAQRHLAERSTDSILASLATVVERWLHPTSPWRRCAEEVLPAATGFSPEMVRYALPFMLEPLKAPALSELLDAELGDRSVLDAPNGHRRVQAPGLVGHILAGNLPGLAAVPVVLTLAIKSAALIKAGRDDRIFPALWSRSLAEVDADLGGCVATCYWPGGDRSCEERVFSAADLVIASGDDVSIEDARSRASGLFIGHGHKISFAVITREVVVDDTATADAAEALALDVAVWDQRGCLSPQICFIEGGFDEACRFGEALGRSLVALAGRLPPGETSLAEQVALQRFREEAEWRRIGGAPIALFAAEGATSGTVVVEEGGAFRPTPLCRSVRVLPLRSNADLMSALVPARRFLECAGLAAAPDRAGKYTALLTRVGVHRICPLGEMQRAPLSWRQGGRPRVANWLSRTGDAS